MPRYANRKTPLPVDGQYRYLKYKDRYQGIIKKRARSDTPRSDFTIKKLTLHPDKVEANRRCLAWPYCDTEIVDNNFNIACNNHWYLLPRDLRKEITYALSHYPVRSKMRQALLKRAKQRLQLAGKRGEMKRDHMNDYTVVEERREQL